MCKKAVCLFLTLTISLCLFSACQSIRMKDSDMDIYERIHAHYSKMTCYSARAELTVLSNKTENRYTMEQKAMGLNKFYAKTQNEDGLGMTLICDGQTTKTLTVSSDYSVTLPYRDVQHLLFVNSFFKAYYASEETAITVNGAPGGAPDANVTVLETEIVPKSTQFAYAALTIDNKTLAPLKLTLYGMGKSATCVLTYSDFSYNDKSVSDAVFTTDKQRG